MQSRLRLHLLTLLTMTAICVLSGSLRAADIKAAVASNHRPAADRERDETSRPVAVLEFFGVPEGGVAVDLFGGGGYYSEILARAMGPSGRVYLHNNQAYLNFTADAVEARLANGRLPNVVRYDRELNAIDLADDSVDLVLMVMTYHDLYYKTDDWDLDPDRFFAMLHRILKPGGILAIVDHAALPGSGSSAAQDLHRIDPEFARQDIQSYGFELRAESDLLANPDDPRTISVFDESIRGRTAKFLMKFVEPES
jgi:predicted methyltransferase